MHKAKFLIRVKENVNDPRLHQAIVLPAIEYKNFILFIGNLNLNKVLKI